MFANKVIEEFINIYLGTACPQLLQVVHLLCNLCKNFIKQFSECVCEPRAKTEHQQPAWYHYWDNEMSPHGYSQSRLASTQYWCGNITASCQWQEDL